MYIAKGPTPVKELAHVSYALVVTKLPADTEFLLETALLKLVIHDATYKEHEQRANSNNYDSNCCPHRFLLLF